MKIWPVAFLATVAVAATGPASSEQTELLSIASYKLQQTELIGRVGRAVQQARLQSSDDHISQACVNGTETVNADSSYQDALSQIESCPTSTDESTLTIKVDYSSCQPAIGNVQLACTTAGGQIQAIPEMSISCRAMGKTIKANVLNFPTCIGKDCPGDIMADDDVKEVFEAEMAKTLEGEFRNAGMPVSCSGSGSGGGSTPPPPTPYSPTPPTSASSKVSAWAAGALALGGLAL
mmetsp:Transcript_3736/g.7583  ORF Transcript_3736/g.7583 Transcript_3736/m.7583 type:complete len:235 (-) Transcript_3736:155-859(-)